VDEGGTERNQGPRVERAVISATGIDDGAAQALQSGIDRSRPDRGLAGLELRPARPPSGAPVVDALTVWAAAASAGPGSAPSSRRKSSVQRMTWRAAASPSPDAARQRTSSVWKFSSNGFA
jgi:hypothetical protein